MKQNGDPESNLFFCGDLVDDCRVKASLIGIYDTQHSCFITVHANHWEKMKDVGGGRNKSKVY